MEKTDMVNKPAEYVIEAPENYLGDVLIHLNELGAWFKDLEKRGGTSRLRFRAPEANMQGFQDWLERATRTTNGTSFRFYRNLH
jgi:predicted membrane GTPase involved in stress response